MPAQIIFRLILRRRGRRQHGNRPLELATGMLNHRGSQLRRPLVAIALGGLALNLKAGLAQGLNRLPDTFPAEIKLVRQRLAGHKGPRVVQ